MENRRFEDKDHASRYAQARFSYPADLKDTILDLLTENTDFRPPFCQLIDVGCGSGQSTPLFADHFDRLIGLDVSQAQIEEANTRNTYANIKYLIGDASSLPVEDESTEIITAATAVHWFDIPKFYEEVRRMLKPGGVLALWGSALKHGSIECVDNAQRSKAATDTLRQIVDEEWAGWGRKNANKGHYIHELKPCFQTEKRYNTKVAVKQTLDEFILYMSTFSSFEKIQQSDKTRDYSAEIKNRFLNALGYPESAGDTKLTVSVPLYCLFTKK
ncbi:putative methyltransferase DDB_G0268948 [Tubulanus polymorphus]|uniref:putative methyltransferase DDB_G0268948 n=1 Tax=Tubulanus polymorphus TaxID=672921 RepID=UPI003DA2AFCD